MASTVPLATPSKQSKIGMSWPPGKTSIRNRPPLVSSTALAILTAAPCSMSSVVGHAVTMRHWTFAWAITAGAPAMVVAATTAAAPAFPRNARRAVIASSAGDQLMVGALSDVIPRTHQRLELREGAGQQIERGVGL